MFYIKHCTLIFFYLNLSEQLTFAATSFSSLPQPYYRRFITIFIAVLAFAAYFGAR
jgi:hypothetical protein